MTMKARLLVLRSLVVTLMRNSRKVIVVDNMNIANDASIINDIGFVERSPLDAEFLSGEGTLSQP